MNSIPKEALPIPNWEHKEKDPKTDLMTFSHSRIKYKPVYFEQGISGAISDCYLRREVWIRLEKALSYLPTGYSFLILDGWRPFEVQNELYEGFKKEYQKQHPEVENIEKEITAFVSKPTRDLEHSFVHGTGGAVDVTILDRKGIPLNMGTEFDDFTEKANTAYFEDSEEEEIKHNRRMLYFAMKEAGFTNLPSEWWHYDFGNQFWSYYTGKPIRYRGMEKE